MRRNLFVLFFGLVSVTAQAQRSDVRVQAACGMILDGSAEGAARPAVVTALRVFAEMVEPPWRAARYAPTPGSAPSPASEAKYEAFSSREVTWSTNWNGDLVPLSRAVNVALSAQEGARLFAGENLAFTRWAVVEGAGAIKLRLAKRRLEAWATPILSPLRTQVRRSLDRSQSPLGRDVQAATDTLVERIINLFATDVEATTQVDLHGEMEFLNLVGAALSGGAPLGGTPGPMIYRDRTFSLDLRLTDSLGGLLRLPTAAEIETAYVKRKGGSPTRLDRKIQVIELLKYDSEKRRWVLHQAMRDVTLGELFD